MIGNYIEYAGVICEVEEIHKKTITTNGVNAPISSFLSIPLTEEWLLNFGFEEREFNGDHSVWHMAFPSSCSFELVADSNGWWYYDRFGNGIEIKHVSQLQNLYFCLTGEELTIKK